MSKDKGAPADAEIDRLIDLVRKNEREAILCWLVETAPDIALIAGAPKWRAFLWALLHPIRFEVGAAIADAGLAIHRGDHRAVASESQSQEPQ